MAKYNFDMNLIKASYDKDLEDAKKEWVSIGKDTRQSQDGLCICQHKVKHIIYMFNMKTKLTIIVGSKCAKKFELDKVISLPNKILREILNSNLLKGDYEIIDNIIIYSNNIEEQFIKYFENKIDDNDNQNKLLEIQNEIKELIDIYSLKYLNNIYETINNKLIEIQKKIKEKENIKNEIYENKINEIEGNEYNDKLNCICGIIKNNICICQTPNYELIKLSGNFFCVNCNKWKCRCIHIIEK